MFAQFVIVGGDDPHYNAPCEEGQSVPIMTPREVSTDEVEARRIMGRPPQPDDSHGQRFALANRLMDANKLEYARRVLLKTPLPGAPDPLRYQMLRKLALCTYKNPDQPLGRRLREAESYAKEVWSDTRASADLRQDALGIAGAIAKRRWECYGLRKHLQIALDYYCQGYGFGKKDDDCTPGIFMDRGYTAVNAAFILDLLAASPDTRESGVVQNAEANRLRSDIIRVLETLLEERKDTADAKPLDFWFYVTLGEAYLGLGNYGRAASCMEGAAKLIWDGTGPRPGHEAAPWQVETSARQIARLARMRAERDGVSAADTEKSKPWEVLKALLGGNAETAASFLRGRVGLALSGGGFRASLFHIGVLARLAELDLLRHIEVLSCVSGGSILGAFYYLELRNLLTKKEDAATTREDYIALVARVEELFLSGVQRNIRLRMMFGLRSNWKVLRSFRCSNTDRLAELYEHELFSTVKKRRDPAPSEPVHPLDDGDKDVPPQLADLKVMPKGCTTFDPKYDNWRRRNKVPNLVVNATTLNTCHNWQFTASYMGEPPARDADESIDGNDRLRRMYHDEAPTQYREVGGRVRLGQAVAASACVPGLFTPLLLDDLYGTTFDARHPEDYLTRLVDGGVYDNQGVSSLLQQDCTVLLISDACGQTGLALHPKSGQFGVMKRSNDILMARVRESQYEMLEALHRSGAIRGFFYVHLKKGLTGGPVNWLECPDRTQRDAPTEQTTYGVRCDVQRLLAGIRTDLDSFSDAEADALMFSAYQMTKEVAESLPFTTHPEATAAPWRFLDIGPIAGAALDNSEVASLRKTLAVAAELAFKPLRILAPISLPAAALPSLVVATLLAALVLLPETTWHLRFVWKPVLAAALIFGAIELFLQHVVHYRASALRWLFALVCIPGSVLLELYLHTVERIYTRSGPKYRLPQRAKAAKQAASR
jgi:predicted acylesterase/phospholipase RssA